MLKDNTCSPKLVPREDPSKEREPDPPASPQPQELPSLSFILRNVTTCFCPFTPRLRHRQTSFLWCLFLCLLLALLRLPMLGHYKGKTKHGDFHKSGRFCPSRDTQYFALQSPGGSVQSVWVGLGICLPSSQVASTISHSPGRRKMLGVGI